MTNIPFGNPGKAGSETEAFTQHDLMLSDVPNLFTEDMTVADGQDLAIYEVVGVDGSGNIIPAVLGTTAAIGVMSGAIVTSGATASVQIIRGGHFNGDALVWDATYDDDAKKIAAFRGADTPTQIVVGFNKYHRKA